MFKKKKQFVMAPIDPRTECAVKICHNQASTLNAVDTGVLDITGAVVVYLCLDCHDDREKRRAEKQEARAKAKAEK